MTGEFWRHLTRNIRTPSHVPVTERRYYLIGLLTTLFPLLFHFGMVVVFGTLNVPVLFVFNVFSVLLYVFLFAVVLLRGQYFTAIITGALEVVAHQVLCVIWLGWEAGFQYYLLSYIFAIGLLPPRRLSLIAVFDLLYAAVFLILALFVRGQPALQPLDPVWTYGLNTVNLVFFLLLITLGTIYYSRLSHLAEQKARTEYDRAEGLLRNILPDSIALRLKSDPRTIADGFDNATVLFADIVDFTRLSQDMTANQIVDLLNTVFSRFDELADKHRLEKIKTIGDAYMVVAGAPQSCEDHAERVIGFALDAMQELEKINLQYGTEIKVRIGVNSGAIVAGVIGKKKFIYDLWGDAVNLASRLESYGIPDRIQVGENTYQLLKDKYRFIDRGWIEVKGKGPVHAYLLDPVQHCALVDPASAPV